MASTDAVRQPWFGGARTLEEQLLGLEPALAEARGKTVLDLGCAEGAIALEFAKAGASSVYACDYNEAMIESANSELAKLGPLSVDFKHTDIEQMIDGVLVNAWTERHKPQRTQFDIVLALAVLHKLRDPVAGVRYCAESARELIVIRLPKGSTGVIRGKHYQHMTADIPKILLACGFKRERKEPGPRGEWVHYYRRVPKAGEE